MIPACFVHVKVHSCSYMMAQVAGAFAAAIVSLIIGGDVTNVPAPHVYRNLPEYVRVLIDGAK